MNHHKLPVNLTWLIKSDGELDIIFLIRSQNGEYRVLSNQVHFSSPFFLPLWEKSSSRLLDWPSKNLLSPIIRFSLGTDTVSMKNGSIWHFSKHFCILTLKNLRKLTVRTCPRSPRSIFRIVPIIQFGLHWFVWRPSLVWRPEVLLNGEPNRLNTVYLTDFIAKKKKSTKEETKYSS